MAKILFDKISVLVVEDNMHMRRIVRALLSGFGIREIYEAEDGAAGLEAFQQFSPDVVITDWVMPIFDGYELAQMIRKDNGTNPYCPIIMLTGHSEKRRVIEARDIGVNEFLAKPISAKSLYLRLYSVIAMPRQFVKTKTYFGPDRRRVEGNGFKGEDRRDPDRSEKFLVDETAQSRKAG
ncbi:MAG: response regulator [Rhodobiaceae bacterium]|nr:response regulator [Rhodobiaceae bacterium]MCC0055972.1 response regulator [Rhodobiaceae bacterium]